MENPCHMCKDWQENGDGSQFICDICHNEPEEEEEEEEEVDVNDVADVEFPDDADDADDDKSELDDIIPWREVSLMKWQRVIKTLKINTVNGPAIILTLQTRKGPIYQAWSTKRIGEKITIKEKEKGIKNLFIKNMGKRDCKNSKKIYYDFRCKIM